MIGKAVLLAMFLGMCACAPMTFEAETECPREGGIGGTGECSADQAS